MLRADRERVGVRIGFGPVAAPGLAAALRGGLPCTPPAFLLLLLLFLPLPPRRARRLPVSTGERKSAFLRMRSSRVSEYLDRSVFVASHALRGRAAAGRVVCAADTGLAPARRRIGCPANTRVGGVPIGDSAAKPEHSESLCA